jgi:NET1-associated nuclear protein 1 (U3 small nucleolar RNA-associated protein 17)
MFGKDAFLDDLELAPEQTQAAVAVSALQRRAAGHPEQVFDGPSHTLPPVGMLFDAFMDELLGSPDDEADANAGEAIEIDTPQGITAAPLSLASDAVRKVRDDEMVELESFFSTLLSNAPPKAKMTSLTGNGTPSQQKKGGVPNGHSVSTPSKLPHSPAVSTPCGDEPEVTDKKGKSKKRKAPRTSQA